MKTVSVLLLAILFFGCGGYKSPTQAPAQAAIVPVVTAIMSNSAIAGAPGFTLTVNGSNFNNNAVVNWNSAQQPTTHVTTNQLTVAVPAANIATAGMVSVTVTNPGSSTQAVRMVVAVPRRARLPQA